MYLSTWSRSTSMPNLEFNDSSCHMIIFKMWFRSQNRIIRWHLKYIYSLEFVSINKSAECAQENAEKQPQIAIISNKILKIIGI